METVPFGKTGRTVSRIGFGGATAGLRNYLGSFDPQTEKDRQGILEAIERALTLGITYFDTAPGYGKGASESIFGEGLAGTDPESIYLATKVGSWSDGDVRESLEGSLERLRRDSIDLLQVHGTVYEGAHRERILRPGGFLDQMEALKSEGLVRQIGFTTEALTPAVWDFIATGRFDVVQVQYNLLFQHPHLFNREAGLLPDAKQAGMGTVTMRSLTSGLFQRWMKTVRPDDDFDYSAALIQFVLSDPLVDVALLGMRNAREVEQNVAIASDPAGRQALSEINESYV